MKIEIGTFTIDEIANKIWGKGNYYKKNLRRNTTTWLRNAGIGFKIQPFINEVEITFVPQMEYGKLGDIKKFLTENYNYTPRTMDKLEWMIGTAYCLYNNFDNFQYTTQKEKVDILTKLLGRNKPNYAEIQKFIINYIKHPLRILTELEIINWNENPTPYYYGGETGQDKIFLKENEEPPINVNKYELYSYSCNEDNENNKKFFRLCNEYFEADKETKIEIKYN